MRLIAAAGAFFAVALSGVPNLHAESFTDSGGPRPGMPRLFEQEDAASVPPPSEVPGTERLGAALDNLAQENPLLARVNGEEIHWVDVMESARELPAEYRDQLEAIFPVLIERLIDIKLIVSAGRQAGLAEDPEVRHLVTEFEDRIISETFVRRRVASLVSTEMLRARYDRYVQGLEAGAEVRVRHILLGNKESARSIIAMLDSGADFAELAKAHSLGPSAEHGGDLHYVTRDYMTPAFAEVAFALEIGAYSRIPVETQFGWHVIKVEDRRAAEPESFFNMRDRLREQVTRELLDNLLSDLRRKAEIELYPDADPLR